MPTEDMPAGSLPDHPLRSAVLAEVHARPFLPLPVPSRVLRLAYETNAQEVGADLAAISDLCLRQGLPTPVSDARIHAADLPGVTLRWERHSEFVTHTLVVSGDDITAGEWPERLAAARRSLPMTGRLLVACDLVILPAVRAPDSAEGFDPMSLARSVVDGGAATIATDFRVWHDGFVRYRVTDHGLTPIAAGALVQRLLELETYRTFALLGLPEAQRHAPSVQKVEAKLASLTSRMTLAKGLDANRDLLAELSELASELEAGAAAAAYRFSATRAYDGLVQGRLKAFQEQTIPGSPTLGAFLDRRMAPALRTCQAIEDRQANLSRKLTRAANLLRTRVDVDLEEQNRNLLFDMKKSADAQLRLQQTVEGLSIAAVTYYIVGLVGYLAKGAKEAGLISMSPEIIMAATLPVAFVLFGIYVVRLRNNHKS